MTTRAEFYEVAVENMTETEFFRMFGVHPLDIMDFDYDFDNVTWNASLEYYYNNYIAEEEYANESN